MTTDDNKALVQRFYEEVINQHLPYRQWQDSGTLGPPRPALSTPTARCCPSTGPRELKSSLHYVRLH